MATPYPNAPSPLAGYGNTPASGSNNPYFDDPTTQPLMGAWNQRMTQLNQPSPTYGDISGILGQYLQPNGQFQGAINSLTGLGNSAGASNAYTGQYADSVAQRKKELNAEPFSTSDEAALKARFFDSLALDRDAAYQQNAQQMASRGLAPSSGVAQALGAETSAGYQKARAGQQQQMLQYVTDERNRRRDLAVTEAQGLAQQGGQDAALAQSWQNARAGIFGTIANALLNQQGQGITAATNMASLRRQSYLDDQSRGDALLQTSAIPSSIATQRMATLQNTLSGNQANQTQMLQLQAQLDAARRSGNMQLAGAIMGSMATLGGAYINSRGRGNTQQQNPLSYSNYDYTDYSGLYNGGGGSGYTPGSGILTGTGDTNPNNYGYG